MRWRSSKWSHWKSQYPIIYSLIIRFVVIFCSVKIFFSPLKLEISTSFPSHYASHRSKLIVLGLIWIKKKTISLLLKVRQYFKNVNPELKTTFQVRKLVPKVSKVYFCFFLNNSKKKRKNVHRGKGGFSRLTYSITT